VQGGSVANYATRCVAADGVSRAPRIGQPQIERTIARHLLVQWISSRRPGGREAASTAHR